MSGSAEPPLSPHVLALHEQLERIVEGDAGQALPDLRQALIRVTPDDAQHHRDAAAVLHLAGLLIDENFTGSTIWSWANSIAEPWQRHGAVVSLLAEVGNLVRLTDESGQKELLNAQVTEELFRRSLQLEETRPSNFLRAGDHFLREGDAEEAERCFANAFRLEPDAAPYVARLAELFRDAGRFADELQVLETSLEAGCQDSRIAFDAAVAAFELQQFETVLTHLDRFEDLGGVNDWVLYYRVVCEYELARPLEALDRLEKHGIDESGTRTQDWHLHVIHGVVLARLGHHQRSEAGLRLAVSQPLHSVDHMSPAGISSLLMRAMHAARHDLNDPNLASLIERRLLRSGLMLDDYFATLRTGEHALQPQRLWECVVRQPLDVSWQTDPDRLAGQSDWDCYLAEWGIFAETAEEASALALNWQVRCGSPDASVVDVRPTTEPLREVTGVAWQGNRFPPEEFDEPGRSVAGE